MERHGDSDCDLSQDDDADLPDMFESSDDDDDEAYTRSRFALPSRFQQAKLQEENGKEDRFESDSEGELSGYSEQSESREFERESEIQLDVFRQEECIQMFLDNMF